MQLHIISYMYSNDYGSSEYILEQNIITVVLWNVCYTYYIGHNE